MNTYLKRLSVLCVFVLFLQSTQCDDLLVCISQEGIVSKTEKIAEEFNKIDLIKKGLVTSSLLISGVILYKIMNPTPEPISMPLELPKPVNQMNNDQVVEQLRREVHKLAIRNNGQHRIIAQQAELLSELGYNTTPLSWQWFKGYLKSFGRYYVTISIAQIVSGTLTPVTKYFKKLDAAVDRVIAKLFPQGDVNWFIDEHCGLFDLFDQLETDVCGMIQAQAHDESLYYVDSFAKTWALSVGQLEAVFGFMQYKAQSFDTSDEGEQRNRQRILDLIMHTQVYIDQFRAQTEQTLQAIAAQTKTDIKRETIRTELEQFRTRINSSIGHFACLEAQVLF